MKFYKDRVNQRIVSVKDGRGIGILISSVYRGGTDSHEGIIEDMLAAGISNILTDKPLEALEGPKHHYHGLTLAEVLANCEEVTL